MQTVAVGDPFRSDSEQNSEGQYNDGEKGVPAVTTAALMAGTALWAGRWARHSRERVGVIFAGLFLFLAADDWRQIHEWLEWTTGVDWQVPYPPLAASGAVLFVLIFRKLPTGPNPARRLWVGGGASIAIALLLEPLQWGTADWQVDGYAAMMVVEEFFEMVTPAAFSLALILAIAEHGLRGRHYRDVPSPRCGNGGMPRPRLRTGTRARVPNLRICAPGMSA
ncbi:MAG: hypothetical protein R8G01_09275 [Ilumatobacteraceae bacterium]|nr:hypothetical protein [Ilumatobacteraceae bacterium]